ncbi:MAG: FKBP-type peptidyl-prolyl cis-trans isomerase [Gemmatimonadaceae bacterium]|nr:FKBP-type peptidyl-prolyl cis-trans isomerase [Chitinophagaceae bacterium]
MKKLSFIVIGTGLLVFAGQAQTKTTKPPVRKGGVTSVAAKKPIRTGIDSLSYAIGMSLANFYKQQGITNINTALCNQGISDVLRSEKTLLTEEQMNMSITNYLQNLKSEKASGNKKAGETFLAENKSKPGVLTTASGMQYQIIKEGTGEKPGPTDQVKCHYHGTLLDGTVFDSSVDRGQPATFPVNGVISGWVEALQMMPVGSKWRLFLPSNLAYGDSQAGPKIAPGSTLIFDVELLEIVK